MIPRILGCLLVATSMARVDARPIQSNQDTSGSALHLIPVAQLPVASGAILSGDADHDGKREFVFGRYPGRDGAFFEEDSTGGFESVARFFIGKQSGENLLAMGDIDGDGLTDLFFERLTPPCTSIPPCYEYVRLEASVPSGFPDHVVWTYPKHGFSLDLQGFIVDSDGDGLPELIVTDNDSGCGFCSGSGVKVFESAPGNQMRLIYNHQFSVGGPSLGTPVVADFDGDGRQEIVIPSSSGLSLLVFEAIGDDSFVLAAQQLIGMTNALHLGVIDHDSPDGIPMLIQSGQPSIIGTGIRVYEAVGNNMLGQVSETLYSMGPCYGQTWLQVGDIVGDAVPEIVVADTCGLLISYAVQAGGRLALLDGIDGIHPAHIALIPQRIPGRPGKVAVQTGGATAVFELH